MNCGMLWFDDSKVGLGQKIEKAREYYRKKYGREPDIAMVHPTTLADGALGTDLKILPYRVVLPGHIWIGREDTP